MPDDFKWGDVVGPAIAGGLSLVGQASTNTANAKEAMLTRAFNAAEAEKARNWSQMMSDTAYRRKVADLEAAGLNPALAYEGQGASTPSASTGSGTPARFDSSVGAGVSSAMRAMEFRQSALNNAATRTATMASADLTKAQADNVRTMMLANLEEVKTRARQNNAYAAKAGTENRGLQESFDIRMDALRAEIARDLSSARESGRRFEMLGTQKQLLDLSIPAAKNMSAAADTWWGKKISPFLNDAKAVNSMFMPWMLQFR